MRLTRIIFTFLIAISLALAPVAFAHAVVHDSSMPAVSADTETGMDMPGMDMADCHKARGSTPNNECTCCDTTSKCPDQATCMMKCCKALGAVRSAARIVSLVLFHYRPADPEKPPNWVNAPPAPPPRS